MNRENAYEQLAEFYLSLKPNHSLDDIYCLCSRVVIKDYQLLEDFDFSENPIESNPHFFSSSTESPPLQKLNTKKESHEEIVSCYCSASHCSTDEHDSVRESALHSDSGADLSESSRDLEWEKYWAANGEKIVWESWRVKYKEYIDPNFTKEFETDETLFIVDSSGAALNHKTTFTGCLDSIKETNESSSADSADVQPIVENFDEPLRLSFSSESSKLSFSIGTTDSLTNVTRVTVSSSDFSFDDSSKSLSSDSSSNEAQWQQIWTEHVDRQYQLTYHEFIARRRFSSPPYFPDLHDPNPVLETEEVDELETEEEKENLLPGTEEASDLATSKESKRRCQKSLVPRDASKTVGRKQLSVGYILNNLRSISLEEEAQDMSHPDPCETDPSAGCDSVTESDCLPSTGLVEALQMERRVSSGEASCESDQNQPLVDHVSSPRHVSKNSLKRVHDEDSECLDRVKGAFSLMGFMFDPEAGQGETIKTAQVVYKRNIKSHNRALRFYPPSNHHDSHLARQVLMDKVRKFLDESEVGSGISEGNEACTSHDPDLFSEKDDSESDRFFSAEELTPSRERQKKKKRRKKPGLPREIMEDAGLLKYWRQRYRLFSRFDQGIKLDSESWYSVTPEKIALHHAERCRCDIIIDAFCGAGGNTIQFAFTCMKVIAIDIDPKKIELARHNAQVYGVDDRIEFVVGDFFELAPRLLADVVFLSPPWGGPKYTRKQCFSVEQLCPVGGDCLYQVASAISPNVAVYLPKNINTSEVVKLAGPGGFVEMEQNFLEKKLVAVTAYFGELVGAVE